MRQRIPSIILSLSLALVFGYFGLDKFQHSIIWIGWIPSWMDGLLSFSSNGWLHIVGLVEMFTAVLLLVPQRKVRSAGALLAAAQLTAILTQTGWNDVAARDVGLLAAALALFFLLREE